MADTTSTTTAPPSFTQSVTNISQALGYTTSDTLLFLILNQLEQLADKQALVEQHLAHATTDLCHIHEHLTEAKS